MSEMRELSYEYLKEECFRQRKIQYNDPMAGVYLKGSRKSKETSIAGVD